MNRLIRNACWLALGLAVVAGAALADDKDEGKWVSLFDGKTLGGWTIADGTAGEWKVVDGVIHGSGPASHLFSPRGDYKNFRYRAEVKIADNDDELPSDTTQDFDGRYFMDSRCIQDNDFPRTISELIGVSSSGHNYRNQSGGGAGNTGNQN